tara:strand:- start:2420 stop:2659 length:240 start_codon:yes stop_codon:yes gene_type:complete
MDKQLAEKIIKDVEATLKTRIRRGSNESEIDYLTGAMAVIVAIEKHVFQTDEKEQMKNVPPKWIFNCIRGESIFEEEGE